MAALNDSRPVEPVRDHYIAYEAALYALRQNQSESQQMSRPNRATAIVFAVVSLAIAAYIGSLAFGQHQIIPEAIIYKRIEDCTINLIPPDGYRGAWTKLEDGSIGCELIPR